MGLAEHLDLPVAGRQPARYRLYAVIVHAGHSPDAGHYFSFCRASDGGGGVAEDGGDDGRWWRLDDSSAAPVSAAVVLGQPRQSTDTAYILLYRLEGAEVAGGRLLAPVDPPGPLRASVQQDSAVHRRSRHGRLVRAPPACS